MNITIGGVDVELNEINLDPNKTYTFSIDAGSMTQESCSKFLRKVKETFVNMNIDNGNIVYIAHSGFNHITIKEDYTDNVQHIC